MERDSDFTKFIQERRKRHHELLQNVKTMHMKGELQICTSEAGVCAFCNRTAEYTSDSPSLTKLTRDFCYIIADDLFQTKEKWLLVSFILEDLVVKDVGRLIQMILYNFWMDAHPLCYDVKCSEFWTGVKR